MKISKRVVAMSMVIFGLSFGMSGIQADAAFVKRTEVKKTQEKKKSVVISDYSAIFDANYYYITYPDLQFAFGNDEKALVDHFVKCGM